MNETRVHILGAAGSGTTTLARALAARLRCAHVDVDDFFWEPTEPPYLRKRTPETRLTSLTRALASPSWTLSGSLVGWGDSLRERFTHVVYISLPAEERMARLRGRESARFGARIEPGGDMHRQHLDFMAWAARYDKGGMDVRSRALHERWLATLTCPVVRVSGLGTTAEQRDLILNGMK